MPPPRRRAESRGLVGLGDGFRQQGEQGTPVAGHFGGGVQVGVGVHGEAQSGAFGAVVHVEREVVDGTGRDVVHRAAVSGEPQVVGERHDVDARAGEPSSSAHQSQVAADLLVAVTLVRQCRAHLAGDRGDQRPQAVVRADGQPQRQDVADHSGHAQDTEPKRPIAGTLSTVSGAPVARWR